MHNNFFYYYFIIGNVRCTQLEFGNVRCTQLEMSVVLDFKKKSIMQYMNSITPIKKDTLNFLPTGIIDPLLDQFGYKVELPYNFDMKVNEKIKTKKICTFLNNNYLNKKESFNLQFTETHLNRIFVPDSFCISVHTIKDNKIIGFIGAKPILYRVYDQCISSYEILLMCTHRKVRGKKLTQVLMKQMFNELVKRKKLTGNIFNTQNALSDNPIIIPFKWLMRPLNIQTSRHFLFKNVTNEQNSKLVKYYNIPESYKDDLERIQIFTEKDVPYVLKIWNQFYSNCSVCHIYTLYTFWEQFRPDQDIYSYTIRSSDNDIDDFVSVVVKNSNAGHKFGYLYGITYISKEVLQFIMKHLLYILEQKGIDIFYIPDILKLKGTCLKFRESNISSNYTIYNYNSKNVSNIANGLILI